ncbi:MAG: FecR domain-containing protein [Rhodospirillales bacterium]
MTGAPHPIDDETWNAAFDWLMQAENNPGDPALAAALQVWLDADATHALAFEQVRRTWQAAPHLQPALADHTPPAPFHPVPIRPAPRLNRRQVLTGAGAMAAGLALYAGTGAPRRLFADIATATGELRTVTLEDGTHVHMDTATALRLDFTGHRRRAALLGGRAYFDVARDAARPFVVTAGPAEVTVIGTRFDLRLDDDSVSVAVEHGRVAVGINGQPLTHADGLAGGNSLRIDLATRAVQRAATTPGIDTAWRDGRLEVEDWSIAQVLAELGRYHRGVILLGDAAFGHQRVSGSFDLTRPEQAARSVARAQGGRVRALSPWVLLISPA